MAKEMKTRPLKTKSWRDVLKIHPAAELFPRMSPDELRELGNDIKANGMKHPIVVWYPGEARPRGTNSFKEDSVLLDGRSRLDALEAVGIKLVSDDGAFASPNIGPGGTTLVRIDYVSELGRLQTAYNPPKHFPGVSDPYSYVVSTNIQRRHLTTAQKGEMIEKLLKVKPEQSNRAIADQIKSDHKTVAAKREALEARGEIPHVEKALDSRGRAQPISKPKKPRRISSVSPEATEKAVASSKQSSAIAPVVELPSAIAGAAPLAINSPVGNGDQEVTPPNRNGVGDLIQAVGELTAEQRRKFWTLCAQKWRESMEAALDREQKPIATSVDAEVGETGKADLDKLETILERAGAGGCSPAVLYHTHGIYGGTVESALKDSRFCYLPGGNIGLKSLAAPS